MSFKKLVEVVEHLVYSHTFRSEAVRNEVHKLLGEIRADVDGKPAAPAKTAEEAGTAPAEADKPAGSAGADLEPAGEIPGQETLPDA